MLILIDDQRDIGADIILRNAKAAKRLLEHYPQINESSILMDHDLGGRETGYDILCFMFGLAIWPERFQLVTMNPVGRNNMEQCLRHAGYIKKGAWWWRQ